MTASWHRLDLGTLGRSLCDRPGSEDRCVLVARDGGYDATTVHGTMRLTVAQLGPHLVAAGRTVPTAADLAWLREVG